MASLENLSLLISLAVNQQSSFHLNSQALQLLIWKAQSFQRASCYTYVMFYFFQTSMFLDFFFQNSRLFLVLST